MSGKRYLLDSNIIIDVFRGDAKTIEPISLTQKLFVPVVVIGALYYGAYKSIEHGLILITRDKHFEEVEGVDLEQV